jgi:hypothetical protein
MINENNTASAFNRRERFHGGVGAEPVVAEG